MMKFTGCLALSGYLLLTVTSQAATFSAATVFANGSAANATGPDSITAGFGSVWVAYTNGLDGTGHTSTGSIGNSTVVQYSLSGAIQNTYSLAGSIDGLKIDPNSGTVWALMNQDGNSAVDLINPATKAVTPLTYQTTSPGSGYDDIVFRGNQIFLSYTNPSVSSDTTLVLLNNRISNLTVTPILGYGVSPSTLNDPDSLKLAANGNLVLTSGDDGALNIVSNPGTSSEALSTITLNLAGSPVSGLDDSFLPFAPQGTLYLANTGLNQVLAVQASGLSTSDIYANLGGTANAFGLVNQTTGAFTPIISGLSAPHGLDFLATPEPGTLVLGLAGLLVILYTRKRKLQA